MINKTMPIIITLPTMASTYGSNQSPVSTGSDAYGTGLGDPEPP
jgi:hypothetical protein